MTHPNLRQPLLERIGGMRIPWWIQCSASAGLLVIMALVSACAPPSASNHSTELIDLLAVRGASANGDFETLTYLNPVPSPPESASFTPVQLKIGKSASAALWALVTYPSGGKSTTIDRAFLALPGSPALETINVNFAAVASVAPLAGTPGSRMRFSSDGTTVYVPSGSQILANDVVNLTQQPPILIGGAVTDFDVDEMNHVVVLSPGPVSISGIPGGNLQTLIFPGFTAVSDAPDGSRIALVSPTSVVLLDGKTTKQTAAIPVSSAFDAVFSADGSTLFVGTAGEVIAYDVTVYPPAQLNTSPSLPGKPNLGLLSISPGGGYIFAYDRTSGTIYGWNTFDLSLALQSSAPIPNLVALTSRTELHLKTPPPAPATVTVTAASVPPGLQLQINSVAGVAPFTQQVNPGAPLTLTAPTPQPGTIAGQRYQFLSWSGGGQTIFSHAWSFGGPSSAATYTATFTTQYQLTLKSNLDACPAPTATTPAPQDSGWYDLNTKVAYAIPAALPAGCTFTSFTGSVDPTVAGSVTMDQPRTIVANYTLNSAITITSAPVTGLTVNIDNLPTKTPASPPWSVGSIHKLSAVTPQATTDTQYAFTGWSPGGSLAPDLQVTVPAGTATFTANYGATAYRLNFSVKTASGDPADAGCSAVFNPTASPGGFFAANQTMSISVAAANGWTFTSFSGDVPTSTTPQVSVFMNAPKTIVATCAPPSALTNTVTTSPAGLNVTVDNSTGPAPVSALWNAGTQHTLLAPTPQTVNGNAQYAFSSWSPGGTTNPTLSVTAPSSATTYTANYAATAYLMTFTLQSSGGGAASGCTASLNPALPANGFYPAGTPVTIQVTANGGWTFTSFSGTIPTSTNQQISVPMNQPQNVVATCTPPSAFVNTVTTAPLGLNVTVDNITSQAPASVSWNPGTQHTLLAPTPQTVNGNTQYAFGSWSPGNQVTAALSVTAPSTTTTYTANYTASAYLMSFSLQSTAGGPASGCSASLSPVLPANGFYPTGTQVLITVVANNGWTFDSFIGAVPTSSGQQALVTMNQPQTVVAKCAPPSAISNTVTTSPAGLNVTVDNITSQSPASVVWSAGSQHTLNAPTPQTVNGSTQYAFASWSPGGQTTAALSVTAPAASTTYTANYSLSYLMSFSLQSTAGGAASGCSASFNPALPASGFYPANTPVSILVTAGSGWTFGSFSGTIPTSTNPQISVTMNQPQTIVATCTPPTVFSTVSIGSSPISGVTITVNGNSVSTPAAARWQVPSDHTLVAPATVDVNGTRYTFSSWSTGATTPTLTLTNWNGSPTSFTANYVASQYSVCVTSQSVTGNPVSIQLNPQGTSGPAGCSFFSPGTTVVLSVLHPTVTSLVSHISIDNAAPVQASSAVLTLTSPRAVNITYTLNPAAVFTTTYAHQFNGTTRITTVTNTNTGTSAIVNLSATYTAGADYTIQSISGNSQVTLQPGASQVVTITLKQATNNIPRLILTLDGSYQDILQSQFFISRQYSDPLSGVTHQ